MDAAFTGCVTLDAKVMIRGIVSHGNSKHDCGNKKATNSIICCDYMRLHGALYLHVGG